MKIPKNVGGIDRVARFILAEVFLVVAFFWTYGALQVTLYVLATMILATVLFKYSLLYTLLKVNTCSIHKKTISKLTLMYFAVVFFSIAVVGSYFSVFFTKKIFIEDYNRMNNYYKQTLFYTGQNNRERSVANYENLINEYNIFFKKYSEYRPYTIYSDTKFISDITEVNRIIVSLHDNVEKGDLPLAHKELESVRLIFQDILKRNGFSMLAVYLVDFHDVMEKIITASDNKDLAQVIVVYQEVSDALKLVEEVSDDIEIQTIRQKLEQVATTAREGGAELLPKQAAELKSSFVKVYLKRG